MEQEQQVHIVGLIKRMNAIESTQLKEDQKKKEEQRLLAEENKVSTICRVNLVNSLNQWNYNALNYCTIILYDCCDVIFQREKEEKAKIAPSEMFRRETDKYSKFDDDGVPSHDADGNPLTASQLKKLKKSWQQQNDKYQKQLNKQN